jgi:serine/threonine protein kinase
MGTQEYMAPELLGALAPPPQSTLASITINYPLSDMWSLGAMVFRMLTGASAFLRTWHLFSFCNGTDTLFPNTRLDGRGISLAGQAFIQGLLMPQPTERLTSTAALTNPWVRPDAAAAAAIIPTDESEYVVTSPRYAPSQGP